MSRSIAWSRIFYSILEFQRKAIGLRNSASTQYRIKYWQVIKITVSFSLWAEISVYKIKLFFFLQTLCTEHGENIHFSQHYLPSINTAQHKILIASQNMVWTRKSASDQSGGVTSQGVDNQLSYFPLSFYLLLAWLCKQNRSSASFIYLESKARFTARSKNH